MSVKHKVCSKCEEDKPVDQFYRDRSNVTGYMSWCKSCIVQNKSGKVYGHTSLEVLKTLPTHIAHSSMSLEEAKLILKAYILSRRQNIKFGETLKNCRVERSLSGCSAFIKELKQASLEGKTLEAYMKEGRPHRAEQRVYGVGKAKG